MPAVAAPKANDGKGIGLDEHFHVIYDEIDPYRSWLEFPLQNQRTWVLCKICFPMVFTVLVGQPQSVLNIWFLVSGNVLILS